MTTLTAMDEAQEFSRFERRTDKDMSKLCPKCNVYYDYKYFLVHKCKNEK